MSSEAGPASADSPRRALWVRRAGCLGWVAIAFAPGILQQQLGFGYTMGFLALAGCGIAVLRVRQIHRRGQTIPEAMAASRAERRRQAQARKRSRHAAEALPWLRTRRVNPETMPGVVITPAPPDVPGYHVAGYDVVLLSAGARELFVARQVMRITRLHPKVARNLVESAPVTVLRVPDLSMADAARYMLESGGATVSIADPNR